MKADLKEIVKNGMSYVAKDEATEKLADKVDGMDYVIVRTLSAGVFAGYQESRIGQEVILRKARRIWYWDGAASLSQLAMDGTSKPGTCKFPCEVDKVELLNVIEILACTEKAKNSIQGVKIWKE